MPTATLKKLLSNTETELFRNYDDTGNEVSAIAIHFCNTSASPVKIWVSFVELSGLFINGAIFSGFTIAANSSEYKEIPKRVMALDESIRAYSDTNNVVSCSIDLVGVQQRLIPDIT